MPFSVSTMIVDGNENVVELSWTYTNAEGSISNRLKLLQPYGRIPLKDVTTEVAVEWLTEQMVNTPEQYDAAIAKRKADSEYAKTLEPYAPHPSGPPTPVPMPVPPEEISAPVAKSTKKKK